LDYSRGTDRWAIGLDNRKYISDWDVEKNDIYSINLKTGEKKLIHEKHSGFYYNPNYEISPDGEKLLFWDGGHYYLYDFENDTKQNITEGLSISFIDKEYDKFGYVPSYGFTGWVKGNDAVIVNHKYDLWLLPLDKNLQPKNLTTSVTANDSIRFRFEDYSFENQPEIKDRYIDLSSTILLHAFNTQNKYAGFYLLRDKQLTQLIFKPATYSQSTWRRNPIIEAKDSDAIIYTMGDYQNYPEAYLSTKDFKKPKKITNTNPQQERYNWGKRILIDYTNDDGVPLQAILSIPINHEEGQKLPMLVWSYEKVSNGLYSYSLPYLNGATAPEMLYVSQGYLYLRPDKHR
jgi:hypothetical protein